MRVTVLLWICFHPCLMPWIISGFFPRSSTVHWLMLLTVEVSHAMFMLLLSFHRVSLDIRMGLTSWRLWPTSFNFLLRSHYCGIDFVLDFVNDTASVQFCFNHFISLKESLKLTGQLVVLGCDQVHVVVESINFILHLLWCFELSRVLLFSLIEIILNWIELTVTRLKSDFCICLRDLKFFRSAHLIFVGLLKLTLSLLVSSILLLEVADLVIKLLQFVFYTWDFIVCRWCCVFDRKYVFFALYDQVFLMLNTLRSWFNFWLQPSDLVLWGLIWIVFGRTTLSKIIHFVTLVEVDLLSITDLFLYKLKVSSFTFIAEVWLLHFAS